MPPDRNLTGRFWRTAPRCKRPGAVPGFSVIEMLIAVALVGTLAALAVPALVGQIHKVKNKRAVGDILIIQSEIRQYELDFGTFPASLDDIGRSNLLDPWGNPYQYLRYGDPGWRGKARLDQFLVPLNSTFDLYSMGPDGESRKPLMNPKSWDDVVRAADGAYVGVASEF